MNGAGIAHALRRENGNGNVHALRSDGSNFVVFGPPVNERTFGNALALAIDRNGLLYVAVEQLDAGGFNAEVVVRRFDATANAWLTVVAPFPLGRTFANSAFPQLAIDANNLPVLGFIGGGGQFELQAHRFNGTAWVSLGNAAGLVLSPAAMTLNGAGNPVMAYKQAFGGSNAEALRIAEHNGTVWVPRGQLDSAGNATVQLSNPKVATAADGRVWVSWSKNAGAPADPVNLFRDDGTAFVAVPIVPVLTAFAGRVGVTFLNGDPVVAGVSRAAFVEPRRFRNGAWEAATSHGPFNDPPNITLMSSGSSVLVGHAVFGNVRGIGSVVRVAFP